MNLSPQQKAKLIQYYPELRNWFDAQDKHEELKKIASEAPKLPPEILAKIKAVKGEKGDKGDAFVGSQGAKGDKGDKGDVGKQGLQGIQGLKGDKGDKGKDGKDGRDGRNGKDGKDAENINIEEIVKPINEKISSGMAKIDGRIKLVDQRWHGSGLSKVTTDSTLTGLGTGASPLSVVNSSGITFVENEVVSGSGTTFTLANTPVALSVHVYGAGQRLVLTTDYTISGKIITTVNSWNATDIVADYRK